MFKIAHPDVRGIVLDELSGRAGGSIGAVWERVGDIARFLIGWEIPRLCRGGSKGGEGIAQRSGSRQ